MHNNYYLLRQLSSVLHRNLKGYRIGEIFSQNKNELVLSFYRSESEFFIKALLDPTFCCLSFPQTFHRAKKNSANIFDEILDLKVETIIQTPYDRSFGMEIEDGYMLFFKMYGNRSNIILFQNGDYINQFNHKLKSDRDLKPDVQRFDRDLSLSRFKELKGDYLAFLPVLSKKVVSYFQNRSYDDCQVEEQWAILNEFLKLLDKPVYYITEDNGSPALRLFKDVRVIKELDDPIAALNYFFTKHIKQAHLFDHKSAVRNRISALLKKNEHYISKTTSKLKELKERPKYHEVGDIIMANIHSIQPGSKKVKLFNFYRNTETEITLKPTLSPQKNAEIYYKKGKNETIEIEMLKSNIEARTKETDKLRRTLKNLETVDDFKVVEDLKQEIFHASAGASKKSDPFISVHYMGFDILIGKNNRANDLLTFKTAKKDDLWLHVKDAPGSHVVVRQKPGTNFPKPVIERAAELAAHHSKRKNETVCPVSYTYRKFVRKTKYLKPGEVIVEREQVILVKPQSWENK